MTQIFNTSYFLKILKIKLHNFILSVSQFIFGDHHCNFEVYYERGKKSTKLKLGNFNFKIFEKYNKNAKKVGYQH